MSAKPIREVDGKRILQRHLSAPQIAIQCVQVTATTDWAALAEQHPWLASGQLVAKPDQLIKRRGKLGLILVNASLAEVQQWIAARMESEVAVGACRGRLRTFIVEPFVSHAPADEYYVCIHADRAGNHVLFHHEGGVDIGDVDAKAVVLDVPCTTATLNPADITAALLQHVPAARQPIVAGVVAALYAQFVALHFTYLEVNPLVVVGETAYVLDLAAKLDQTAEFLCKDAWGGEVDYPAPFGRDKLPEEAYIAELDSKSGASLKLTVLNPKGRIWTMVAGGGASVIYSDTICDLGGKDELANYGEYSGAPTTAQTYEYAKTILSLMTKEAHPDGKVLIIGGGIANFTNVAATFKGISKALTEFQPLIKEHRIRIYVRRGGPNYQEGLTALRKLGAELGLDIWVYGPETHMTSICAMALGLMEPPAINLAQPSYLESILGGAAGGSSTVEMTGPDKNYIEHPAVKPLFSKATRAFVFGMQTQAVQSMLDFDFCCGRTVPSVAGVINPFSESHAVKFYYGALEVLVHVYASLAEACAAHPDADVLVNFASLRSAHEVTMSALAQPQIRTVAVIAEGIPENLTRISNAAARAAGKVIIGPATVGGVKPGCFKIGNTGGMIDNIIASKLYRPGSVAYVSRSGGMSNELNNVIARHTNGVYEGVAIGGDRYPGSTFLDHLLRYEADPNAKLLVLLGEVGGTEEYLICDAVRAGKLTKPLVAWCIGTCGTLFDAEVQFGHAGASAHGLAETAAAKNAALKAAGAVVPASFESLGEAIRTTYQQLVAKGVIVPTAEPPAPKVPIDYKWAQELGLVRKPANFISSVSDERGEELLYAGVPITDVIQEDLGIGGVIGLLWFQRRLPAYAAKFIEMCLVVTADHGPAVSGAHNTIVAARAGKDLVSSLCSGLLTIGDRFGGALDDSARQFAGAFDAELTPKAFVDKMRREHTLIAGIGHRVKSISNPDMRVTLIKDFAKKHFAATPLLDYALQVEQVTTQKKPNLILNVDGAIATCFVDLLRGCGVFSRDEAAEYIAIGCLNALFVLGRTTGFIGHYIDQRRLKQGLYRHPWDDISYVTRK